MVVEYNTTVRWVQGEEAAIQTRDLVAIRNSIFHDDKGLTAISNSWHLRLEMTLEAL
jgi:hypothetical protein